MRMTSRQVYVYLLERYGDKMKVSPEELRVACEKTMGHGVGYYFKVAGRMPMLQADDLVQAGVIGLVVAVKCYDPGKGRFWGYAQYIIRKEIFKTIRKNSPIFPRHRWHGDYPVQAFLESKP